MIQDEDWIEISPPVNDSERRALETVREILGTPQERYVVVSNVRLPNGRGDFYEYDAIVVGLTMVFALEFKGWGGRIVCQRDRWFLENGIFEENPSDRIARKAKVLKSLLVGRVRTLRDRLWVQDIVYVNGPGAKLTDVDYELRTSFDVIPTAFDTPAALKSALLTPQRWCRSEPLSDEEHRGIVRYLRGGEKRAVDERIGKYAIDERLAATSERFERLLVHERYQPRDAAAPVELHVYPLDGRRSDDERTAQTFRRQIATVKALGKAGVAPEYLGDDESAWHDKSVRYIAYEWLGRYETLGDRIARAGTIGLRDALRLAIALADAITVMHGQAIVHGALEPSSLHVKPGPNDDPPEVVIGRIELARPRDAGMSVNSISSVGSGASCYASPNVLANRHPNEADDLFSFGAILAHLLRGRPLFASPSEILQQIRLPKLLEDRSTDPPELRKLIGSLLARDAKDRPSSMRDVADALRDILRPLEERRPDAQRIGPYKIIRELRAGATGRTVVAVRDDLEGEVVLKIAPLARDETLRREIERLRPLHHPNVVVAFTGHALDAEGVFIGEFGLVQGEDCERLRGRLTTERMQTLAIGLFSALAYVHAHGLVHRDVKPANVMLGSDGTATLLDFGLACAPGDGDLIIGTAPYKPEQLFERGAWEPRDDVFAAVVTFWETITGKHPWSGLAPQGPPSVEASDLGSLLEKTTASELAAVVRDLLVMPPEGPNAADVAGNRISGLLQPPSGAMLLPLAAPEIQLPVDARLDSFVAAVPLNVRARQALDDLGARTLDDVRSIRVADLSRVKGFGRGVGDEISALAQAVIARFGEAEPPTASVLRSVDAAFASALVSDAVAADDKIDVLKLPRATHELLVALGVTSVAQLAGTDPKRIGGDARIGAVGVASIREALREYIDDRERLVVDAVLPSWRMMERAAFIESVARIGADPARAIDILEVAGGLELVPEHVSILRSAVVAAPPWTETAALGAFEAILAETAWPPRDLAELASAVAARAREDGIEAFASFTAETTQLLIERIAPVLCDLGQSADDRWYRRSVLDVATALAYGADGLVLPTELPLFLQAAERRLPDASLPSPGTPEFMQALDSADFVWLPDGLIDRKGAVPTAKPKAPSDLAGAEVVALTAAAESLVRATRSGGYRLVVADPGAYSARVRALVDELRGVFADRLHVIDFDEQLCRALEETGMLETALRVQAKQGPVVGAIAPLADEAAIQILNGALAGSEGTCTVVVNTGALGLTNVAQHLGKIYDQTRGGTFGLVVVCVPGDHPREHARLNRTVALPQQPTERPIALEEVA